MPNKGGHRRFGNLRKLPSGRFQVRYPGPDGRLRTGPETYATKGVAERALVIIEGQIARGDWVDPERGKVTVRDYADRWIAQRPNLRPRSVELYRWLLGRHITPYLGGVPLGKVTTALVREWRAELLGNGVSASMTAKAYRLLRAVLMTAVNEDHILPANPCRIPGAGTETPDERPTLTVTQVYDLAGEVPDRFFAMILLTTFASLRYGEVTALQRQDVDLEAGTVRVRKRSWNANAAGCCSVRRSHVRGCVPWRCRPWSWPSWVGTWTTTPRPVRKRSCSQGRPARRSNAATSTGCGLEGSGGQARKAGVALPRPAAHREHLGGQ